MINFKFSKYRAQACVGQQYFVFYNILMYVIVSLPLVIKTLNLIREKKKISEFDFMIKRVRI